MDHMDPNEAFYSFIRETPPPAFSAPSPLSTSATQEHCPECRVATPDVVAARVRLGAVLLFARQLRLEVEELAHLLGLVIPADAS